MKNASTPRFIFFTLLLLSFVTWAQVAVSLKQNNVPVKSDPRDTSETLVTLKAGTRVLVKGRNGDWLKVSVTQSGFEFIGWIEKTAFMANRPAPRPTPPPAQTSPNVDQFFDPAPPPTRPAPSSNSSFSSSDSSESALANKLKLNLASGLVFLSHKAAGTAAGEQSLKYDLSGLGIDFLAQYDYWKSSNRKWIAGAELGYEYTTYFSKTDLKDTTGVSFETRDSKNTSGDLNIRATLTNKMSDSLSLGASLGFRMFNFNGDDIIDNSSNALKLYVSSKLTAVPIGLFGTYQVKENIEATLGVNVLLMSSYSEDPEGASGTSPEAGMGFNPYVSAFYKLKDKHRVGMYFEHMSQTINFTGAATRTTFTFTNTETKNSLNTIGFAYRYLF